MHVAKPHDHAAVSREAEQELIRANEDLEDAGRRNDPDALARIFPDEILLIGPRGKTSNKEKYLRSLRSGDNAYESLVVEDRKVRIYGDVGVVTLRRKQKAHIRSYEYPNAVMTLRIWNKRDGKWQLVASSATAVQQPAPSQRH